MKVFVIALEFLIRHLSHKTTDVKNQHKGKTAVTASNLLIYNFLQVSDRV